MKACLEYYINLDPYSTQKSDASMEILVYLIFIEHYHSR